MNTTKLLCEELERNLNSPVLRVRLPAGAELLWRWFNDLSQCRTFGFSGPDPIQYTAIDAYARVNRWPIAPHHVAILMAMDAVFLRYYAQRQRTAEGVKTLPPVSKVPLSAGLLDAMFGG
ncbi:hypothetical protein CFBP6625_01025 [Agrobacterium tumefaciens]|nr:hypothetical protein CFBP6625_01025 [Agrobacterium tumefaciens]